MTVDREIVKPYLEEQADDYSWLDIEIPELVDGPFPPIGNQIDPEPPEKEIVRTMMNTDYLHFAVKHLLNIELLPFQCVILDLLWRKRLPMLIASRGASKSTLLAIYTLLRLIFNPGCKVAAVGAAFRQSREIWENCSNIWENSPLLRDISNVKRDGPKREIDRCEFRLGNSRAYFLPMGCLVGDTLVTTDTGIRRIKELSGNCEQVWSGDEYRNIGYFWDNGVADTIKVTTKNGFEFQSTYDHKMKVVRDNQIQWVRTDEMVEGDRAPIDKSDRWFGFPSYNIGDKDSYLCGRILPLDKTQSIPDKFLQSTKEDISHFLRGVFDGHGKFGPSRSLWFETQNEELSKQVQFILLHFGILSSRDKDRNKYRVTVRGKNITLFLNRIGSAYEGRRNWMSCQSELGNSLSDGVPVFGDNLFFDTVDSIEHIGKVYTYDINVPSNNTYIANGFVSHNSGDKIRGLRAHYILADEFSCCGYNTLIETSRGLMRIGETSDIYNDIKLFTGNENNVVRPSRFIKTPKTDVYKVTLMGGMSFKCSNIHKVMTSNGWKLGKELTDEDYLPMPEAYEFPEEYVHKDGLTVDEDLAWLMGMLTAEGSINSKHSLYVQMCDENLAGLGVDRETCHNKIVPWSILQSPKSVVIAYLKGVFEGGGSAFLFNDKQRGVNNRFGISYYSVSEQLCQEIQVLLWKLGVWSTIRSRKSKISDNPQWMVRLNGIYADKLAKILDIDKWNEILYQAHVPKEPKGYFFNRIKQAWDAAPYYQGKQRYVGSFNNEEEAKLAVEQFRKNNPYCLRVKSVEKLDEQEHLYDYEVPDDHSFMGNCFRQHNSINEDIFATIVQGFGAVASDPVTKVKKKYAEEKLKEEGVWSEEMDDFSDRSFTGNQIVYSGTAHFAFNHFARYFQKWRDIILSKGDEETLEKIIGDHPKNSRGFDWRDYGVIRLPYTMLPPGFLDEGIIAQARANLHSGHFYQEYCAIFISDTKGFFRRSTIENATTNKPIIMKSGEQVKFNVKRSGDKDKVYVIGVDPAADDDNAAIQVLEVHNDHRRLVYTWTTNSKKHKERQRKCKEMGIEIEKNYYNYIASKIKELVSVFNTEQIVMDKHGGGKAIAEALKDTPEEKGGDFAIYESIDPDDPKNEDTLEGLHILNLVKPTPEINSEANHGMLKDLEEKELIFPAFDTVEIEKSLQRDKVSNNTFDTYEDIALEIEETKKEMTTIVVTKTANLGREHFDVPKIKESSTGEGKLRKDRYSALLYANWYCRNKEANEPYKIQYKPVGGTKDTFKYKSNQDGQLYSGPGIAKFGNSSWVKKGNPRGFNRGKNK